MRRIAVLALAAALLGPGWLLAPADAQKEEEAARADRLYGKHCAQCHGEEGRGDGAAAFLLSPKPRDFTRGEFRLITTTNGVPSDDDLLRVLLHGMPGSGMPPWDRLAEADRRLLAAKVKSLWSAGLREGYRAEGTEPEEIEEYVREDTTPGPAVSYAGEGEPTLATLARGRIVYSQACASCHGLDGRGQSQQLLLDSEGHLAPARDFTRGIFKGGAEPRQIYARLRSGMKGTAMPTYGAGGLSEEEAWAVVHHVRTFFPPGAQDLQRQQTQRLEIRKVEALPANAEAWWKLAPPAWIAVMPLWWRDERIEGVVFQAAHDGKTLALRLVWEDQTKEVSNLDQEEFHDGAAVQLSWDADPPFFGMGDDAASVLIWSWKASWQEDETAFRDLEALYPHMNLDTYFPVQKNLKAGDRPELGKFGAEHHDPTWLSGWGAGNPMSNPHRPSAVEVARAKGQGSMTTQEKEEQVVRGHGTWDRGVWTLEVRAPLSPERCRSLFVALAVWNGAQKDRNGQKSVSIWHRLELE